jgi:orotate phosphoribosyltransferase
MTPTHDHLPAHVRALLTGTGALLEGHFLLSSGLHSPYYLQAMRLLQYPQHARAIAKAVAEQFPGMRATATVAPAIGGIVWGYALAEQLPHCRAVFAERVDGRLALRRGFALEPGELVILAEDVTTTGGTVDELRALAEAEGAHVIGVAAVVDRSAGRWRPTVPFHSWARLDIETWPGNACPLCAGGSVACKPGSRPGANGRAA